MFIKIKNADEFYKTWQLLETFNDTVNVICKEDNVYIQVLSAAKTAVVEINYPSTYFAEYKCEKECTIGIFSKVFLKILKNAYKKSEVVLTISLNEDGEVEIVIIQKTFEDELKCTYLMKCMDIDQDLLQIPAPLVHATYSIAAETMKTWKDMLYDGTVSLTPKKDKIVIESKDEHDNKVSLVANAQATNYKTSARVPEEKSTKSVKKKWKTKYINKENFKFVYAMMGVSSNINLQFFIADDTPIEVFTTLSENVQLKAFLAPAESIDEENKEEQEEVVEENTSKRRLLDNHGSSSKRQKAVAAH